ncbi:MAG TPA: hypothetical protein VIL97_08920 [Thermoanaerobaculia bacterium]
MTLNALLLLFAVAGVTTLVIYLRRSVSGHEFDALLAQRGATATICTRAELIDGRNHIPVALALRSSEVSYENPDLHGSLDIARIDEVEYASDLMTGGIATGAVLRLRSHGRAFEFILDLASAEKWSRQLPPHRMGEPGTVHAI